MNVIQSIEWPLEQGPGGNSSLFTSCQCDQQYTPLKTLTPNAQNWWTHRNTRINTQRCQVPCVYSELICLIVLLRSSQEAGGLSHVEPSWQEETREEVHGSPQRHRRRITCTGQEGNRHDTTWTKVWVYGKKICFDKSIIWLNWDRYSCVCLCVCGGSYSPVVFQQLWQPAWFWCQQATLWTNVNRDWLSAHFFSCLTVVNQCTVKAWIFLTPVQNATKKKGIHLPVTPLAFTSSCSASRARRRPWQEKDAAGLSVQRVLCFIWWWHMQRVMPSQIFLKLKVRTAGSNRINSYWVAVPKLS